MKMRRKMNWYKFDEDKLLDDDNIKCFVYYGMDFEIIRFRGRRTMIWGSSTVKAYDEQFFLEQGGMCISDDEEKKLWAFLCDTDKVLYFDGAKMSEETGRHFDDTYYIRADFRESYLKSRE